MTELHQDELNLMCIVGAGIPLWHYQQLLDDGLTHEEIMAAVANPRKFYEGLHELIGLRNDSGHFVSKRNWSLYKLTHGLITGLLPRQAPSNPPGPPPF